MFIILCLPYHLYIVIYCSCSTLVCLSKQIHLSNLLLFISRSLTFLVLDLKLMIKDIPLKFLKVLKLRRI